MLDLKDLHLFTKRPFGGANSEKDIYLKKDDSFLLFLVQHDSNHRRRGYWPDCGAHNYSLWKWKIVWIAVKFCTKIKKSSFLHFFMFSHFWLLENQKDTGDRPRPNLSWGLRAIGQPSTHVEVSFGGQGRGQQFYFGGRCVHLLSKIHFFFIP